MDDEPSVHLLHHHELDRYAGREPSNAKPTGRLVVALPLYRFGHRAPCAANLLRSQVLERVRMDFSVQGIESLHQPPD